MASDNRIYRKLYDMLGTSIDDLVLPETLKPIGRESRVTDGRVDRLVPKVVLDCTGVLTVICELVAAGMPQHVTVNEEGEAGGLASPRDHALIAGNAEGCQDNPDALKELAVSLILAIDL